MKEALLNFLRNRGITNKELALVSLSALFFSLLAISPSIVAWLKTPPGYVFVGNCSYFDPWDMNFYLSNIYWGKLGHWLWQLRHTPSSLQTHFLYFFYTFCGHLARWFSLSPTAIFHIAAVFFSLLLLLTFYLVAIYLLPSRRARLTAYFLAAFGGGWGWAIQRWELAVPDATVFPTLHVPHFAADQWLFLLLLLCGYCLLGGSARSYHAGLKAVSFGAALFLGLIHPYTVVSALTVLGIYGLTTFWRTRDLNWLFAMVPPIGGGLLGMIAPVWALVKDSHLDHLGPPAPTPPYFGFVLGYGALSLLVGVGLYCRKILPPKTALFLLSWLVVQSLLLYTPMPHQRSMIKGYYLNLSLLGGWGFAWLSQRVSVWLRALGWYLLISLFVSQLAFLGLNYLLIRPDNPWTYLKGGEAKALNWLSSLVSSQTVVLSSPSFGNILPIYATARSFYGRLHIDILTQEKIVADFYSSQTSSEWRNKFLRENGVNYVVWGERERQLGDYQPQNEDFWQLVYDQDGTKIYEVAKGKFSGNEEFPKTLVKHER